MKEGREMCLRTISKTKPKSWGYGWKVFVLRDGELYSLYSHCTTYTKYLTGKWIKAEATNNTPVRGTVETYIPQFHVLLSEPESRTRKTLDPYDNCNANQLFYKFGVKGIPTLRKVRYRKAQVQGKDDTYPKGKCVVAEEIYIYKQKGDI